MSTVKIKPQTAVTPLGVVVAVLIAGVLLVGFAIPSLRAVSEERGRPEASPILSAYGRHRVSAVMSDSCCCVGGIGAVPPVP